MNVPKDPKRQEIKDRIAAAQSRHQQRQDGNFTDQLGERAVEAKDSFTEFAREHPVATVAGGLLLGVLIAGMFEGPRRAAVRGGTKASAKAAGLAAIASEMALAFAHQAMDAAADAGRYGADKLDDLGDTVGSTARDLRREASYRADSASVAAQGGKRKVGKSITRAFSRD